MAERKYTASHEWIVIDGDSATIGISDFAQAQLGDVVFLELAAKGAKLKLRKLRLAPNQTRASNLNASNSGICSNDVEV